MVFYVTKNIQFSPDIVNGEFPPSSQPNICSGIDLFSGSEEKTPSGGQLSAHSQTRFNGSKTWGPHNTQEWSLNEKQKYTLNIKRCDCPVPKEKYWFITTLLHFISFLPVSLSCTTLLFSILSSTVSFSLYPNYFPLFSIPFIFWLVGIVFLGNTSNGVQNYCCSSFRITPGSSWGQYECWDQMRILHVKSKYPTYYT